MERTRLFSGKIVVILYMTALKLDMFIKMKKRQKKGATERMNHRGRNFDAYVKPVISALKKKFA
jgi:hypothetical protein